MVTAPPEVEPKKGCDYILSLIMGEKEIIHLCSKILLSGSVKQCARTLKIEVPVNLYDVDIYTQPNLSQLVRFYDNDTLLFYGTIFTVTYTTSYKTITCFDMGYFLKNNYGTYNFKNVTPESVAQRVCTEYSIPIYNLVSTGFNFSRKFSGVSIQQIIDTAYTLASESNGNKYLTRFIGASLNIFIKGEPKSTTIIEGVSNLQNMSYTFSSDGMVNAVKVYDSDGNYISSQQNNKNPPSVYGLRTKILTKRDDTDIQKEIKAIFEDNDIERSINVTVLATNDMISGNAITLREPQTNTDGLFWIDEDSHTWQNGLHTASLTLNFKNIMREGESGTEEKE